MNDKCIMPEQPYCPACPYGLELLSEEDIEIASMAGSLDGTCLEWVCLYDGGGSVDEQT